MLETRVNWIYVIIIFLFLKNVITIHIFGNMPLQFFVSHKNATEYVWTQPGPSCKRIRRRIFHLPVTDTWAPHVIFFPLSSSLSIPTRPRPRLAAARRQPASSSSSTPRASSLRRGRARHGRGELPMATGAELAMAAGAELTRTVCVAPHGRQGRACPRQCCARHGRQDRARPSPMAGARVVVVLASAKALRVRSPHHNLRSPWTI